MLAALLAAGGVAARADAAPPEDRSGRPQKGVASFYGAREAGRPTATGEPLKLGEMTAASRTLPLGTQAKVTNTDTGKSVEVRINDRGPYVDGRVVDVTPKAADALGMKESGTAPVQVKPLAVPPPPAAKKDPG